MTSDNRLALTIEHELPGRLRLRLSNALRQPERVRRLVDEHAGVAEVQYSAISRSMLVRYDPRSISTEEIIIRVATGLSLEHQNADVRVLTQPPVRELTDSAFYSGIVLLAALALRAMGQYATGRATLEGAAGITTAGAALYHGLVDYRLRGNIDPEVLTVTYLLIALLRGNVLPAATLTWVSTFGRHLVRLPARGIVIRPVETGLHGKSPYLEVLIAPDPTPPDKMTFFGVLPTMALQAMTGAASGRHESLIDEVRQIAATHNQVLEGVSDFRRGIRLRIRDTIEALPEPL
jgi:hypothetical protein